MASHDRGMALVSVLMLLALFLALGIMLSDKIMASIQNRTRAVSVTRGYWAATAGIEWARQQLVEQYRSSGGWQHYLAGNPTEGYPPTAQFKIISDGIPISLYLRDNPDGDDDPGYDNDLQVYLLARAGHDRTPQVWIESLCRLIPPGPGSAYPQGHPAEDTNQGQTPLRQDQSHPDLSTFQMGGN